MDSNNFPGNFSVLNPVDHEVQIRLTSLENVGVGEREARIASDLVAQRHYR